MFEKQKIVELIFFFRRNHQFIRNDTNASFSALDFVLENTKLIKCILIEFSVNSLGDAFKHFRSIFLYCWQNQQILPLAYYICAGEAISLFEADSSKNLH